MPVDALMFDAETQKYIDENPALKSVIDRERRLKELEETIDTAPDDEEKLYRLELFKDMAKIQYKKTVELYTKELQKENQAWEKLLQRATDNVLAWEEQYQKLADALQSERMAHNEFYENICFALLVKPRSTFEMILQQLERTEKIKDQDGYENWQWSLNFHFIARLRMAWRLVFGE